MSRIMAPSLSAAINEFLQWLELDRHASAGKYASKHGFDDAPVSDLDRDLVRAYQRAIARARTPRWIWAPRPLTSRTSRDNREMPNRPQAPHPQAPTYT
jgi:hypothetical protein